MHFMWNILLIEWDLSKFLKILLVSIVEVIAGVLEPQR